MAPVPKITIKGLDELKALWAKGGSVVNTALFDATKRAVLYVHSQVPPYPPAPSTSEYVRTGTLGRSITTDVRPVGQGYIGIIGSNVLYSPWVISTEKVPTGQGPQTRVHKSHGWWTLQEVVTKASNEILSFFNSAVQEILGQLRRK